MKKNDELQSMMMEVIKNGIVNNSHNTTNTNSHNKAFNLNFFLNETCKEAMNIGDFVDSLKLQLSDLENVGEAGYIEGISNIIVKNLKEMDITKRPVHCTDKKRETVYIKDNDKWEKDEDRSKMHKLIKKVAFKNANMFAKFREVHPDCTAYHSKFGDQYHKIVYESMGGKGDNDFEKNERIIKNILKEVTIDKNL
jgi:Txe/YoeB family toxin of Txe-Axe toxin-antitoxin module